MTPFVADPDFTLYVGDALEVLRELPAGSVDCCVTSPPYWNLRDYGTAGQLGLEVTPDEYVSALVAVFAEVRRVLAAGGTLWLNLGDSYNAYNGNRGETGSTLEGRRQHLVGRPHVPTGSGLTAPGLKSKDLVGIPWRVAFALQADGWYLRSDIVWSKPNPMPESVTDRPTKSHEYVFLLTKSARYYFDQEGVREPHSRDGRKVTGRTSTEMTHENHRLDEGERRERWPGAGRNVRSVWEIATQPYPEAHFATFPEELPRRCIAAGCPEQVCTTCSTPRERIIDVTYAGHRGRPQADADERRAAGVALVNEGVRADRHASTVGWTDCGHDDYRPGVVLDPFMGSGTTALVARKHGRRSIGIELNPEYARLAAKRLGQQSLLAEAAS